MKEIILSQNKVALVDDEDFDFLSQWKWRAIYCRSGIFYAIRNTVKDGKANTITMHRTIVGLGGGRKQLVDHKDHNGLNNCRSNLRIVTSSQNNQNRKSNKNGTSIYKGVSWNTEYRKWISAMKVDGKFKFLGAFKNEKNAAMAYDKAALAFWGAYAYLNFPMELQKAEENSIKIL